MKKKILIISIIIVVIGLFLASGGSRTDVYLKDFELSQDGKTMTLKVGVSSSAGYVRKMKRTGGSMNYYYTFYSTFGINSKLGAKDTFEIALDQNVDEIYFYTGGKGYKKVLEKNADGEWAKVPASYNDEVKEIVDKTKDKKDFTCAEALESFYEDENYTYFWSCIKNQHIVVKYNSGYEELVSVALKSGAITISDLDDYNIKYIRQAKHNDNDAYQTFEILIKENSSKKLTLASGFNEHNIYYYSLDNARITLNNIEYDLADAISKNKISLEEIVTNMDLKGTFYDGGSKMYSTKPNVYSYSGYYYNILVCNTLDGNRDIYIGSELGDNELKYQSDFCK